MNNVSDVLCCGCAACANICPAKAINMQENSEGFLEPVIDGNKCTNCGLCKKICPVINTKYENNDKPTCFAYMANDEVRKNSSSGGAFYVLAKYFIENQGFVSGAVWDNNCTVKHIVSNKIDDIEKMRTSKYLQSSIGDCYQQIQEILNRGTKVLFTGTPCQIAGLKNYLIKDYVNLFCVDLICNSVPSPKVFRKYIQEGFLNNNDAKWINTDFRDKRYGWGKSSTVTTYTTTNTVAKQANDDDFMRTFFEGICIRKSCSSCVFNRIPRQGDITIGDLWTIKRDKKYNKKYNDTKGTSLILLNNEKGSKLVKILSETNKIFDKIPFDKALVGNPNLTTCTRAHRNRDKFFELLDKVSLKENIARNLDDKCDCMIINYWSSMNYGAILTCFGVQCLAEKLGKDAKIINYIGYPKEVKCDDFEKSFANKFAKKYLNLTRRIKSYDDLYKLNKNCNTFITGSDQVFRSSCAKYLLNGDINWTMFFLDFVRSSKKKLSYAASIGRDEIMEKSVDLEKMNFYLSQFDDISVREDKAVELLKENFDIDSTQVIDSVFHIPEELLNKMADEYPSNEEYIGVFTLPYFNEKEWCKNVLAQISQRLNLPVKYFDWDYTTPVEKWLAFIKNSKYMITDSYHGTLFSIIFNKPFIQVLNAVKAQSRFDTIFKILNIKNKTVSEFDMEYNYDKILAPLDWNFINNKIKEERQRAELWMKKAFDKETKLKPICMNFSENNKESGAKDFVDSETLSLVLNKGRIYRKYLKYKILSAISFGKKRKHYEDKKIELKSKVKQIRELSKPKNSN